MTGKLFVQKDSEREQKGGGNSRAAETAGRRKQPGGG